MEEKHFCYIMLDGHAVQISKKVKSILETFSATGSVEEAAKESKYPKKVVERILDNPLLVKWIAKRVHMVATTQDFGIEELTAFLINAIRGTESGIERKSFGNRLKAVEMYSKINNIGGMNDFGQIKFLLQNESSGDGVEATSGAV